MTLWLIIPVKPLLLGKSRLSIILPPVERALLNRRLLLHTLDTIKGVAEIEQTLVISRDPTVLGIAQWSGARILLETGSPTLNRALTLATITARDGGASSILILPADLPLLSPQDISALTGLIQPSPVVVIAPDRRRQGTNALLVSPPGVIEYSYGPGSFQRHCDQARRVGVRLEIVDSPSLALDVDLPEDLALVKDDLERLST
jgi:2-phospho-L-lactate guanylyltransferase